MLTPDCFSLAMTSKSDSVSVTGECGGWLIEYENTLRRAPMCAPTQQSAGCRERVAQPEL